MRSYETTAPAGASTTLTIKGTFLALTESSEDDKKLRVEAIAHDGAVVIDANMRSGDKFPVGRPFEQVRISNAGEKDVKVTLVAGEGAFQSDRLSGEVTIGGGSIVVDPMAALLVPVFAVQVQTGATAGKYSYVELVNPRGSGVKLAVKSLEAVVSQGHLGLAKIDYKPTFSPLGANHAYDPIQSEVDPDKWGNEKSKAAYSLDNALDSRRSSINPTNRRFNEFMTYFSQHYEVGKPIACDVSSVVLDEGQSLCLYSHSVTAGITAAFRWAEHEH